MRALALAYQPLIGFALRWKNIRTEAPHAAQQLLPRLLYFICLDHLYDHAGSQSRFT
jgi:hypothetical protein